MGARLHREIRAVLDPDGILNPGKVLAGEPALPSAR